MNRKPGLARSARVWSAVLLWGSVLISDASARAPGAPPMILHVDGGAVSADIRAEPLAEVARALARQTDVTMHFLAPEAQEQVITVRFEKLALRAALRALLKHMSYVIVTGPRAQSVGIQVYVYPQLPGDASPPRPVAGAREATGPASAPAPQSAGTPVAGAREATGPASAPAPQSAGTPVAGAREATGPASAPAPQSAGTPAEEPREPPAPPSEVDPDPAVRVRELEETVAASGPQSLALLFAAAHDAEPLVRSAAEQLLLNDVRQGVPKETLATIALSSERADHRLQALEALAARQEQAPYARMTLDGALHDPDPAVRQRAEALLLQLSASEPTRDEPVKALQVE